MINRKSAIDPEPTQALLEAYRTLLDCAGDLSETNAATIVAKAAVNLAMRTLWDVVGLEGAQRALRQAADELPGIIGEEGRLLVIAAPISFEELDAAGFEDAA